MKRLVLVGMSLVLVVAVLMIAGCETWKGASTGAGKDVEHVGEKMQGK